MYLRNSAASLPYIAKEEIIKSSKLHSEIILNRYNFLKYKMKLKTEKNVATVH